MIILLNGPPRCGKDTVAGVIAHRHGAYHTKFARRLKEDTHALYGMPEMAHDAFEHCKDDPCSEFRGLTPRRAYIAVSEKLMKPLHGERIYGEILCEAIRGHVGERDIVVSDSGFVPEALEVVDRFGADQVALVRIHRAGCTFASDSRGYIELLGSRMIDLDNDLALAGFTHRLVALSDDLLVAA